MMTMMNNRVHVGTQRLLDEVVLKGGTTGSVAPEAFTYDALKVADELFALCGDSPDINPKQLASMLTPAMLKDVVEKIAKVYEDAFNDSRYASEQYFDMLHAWVRENLPEAVGPLGLDNE